MYNTGLKPQYLVSYTRPDSTRLEFIFNSPSKKQPTITIVNDETYSNPLKGETTVGNDTLTFWLPKEIASRDTLKLALQYSNVDLLTGIETLVNDTVKLMKPKAQTPKKKDKKKTKTANKDSNKKNKKDTEIETPELSNDSIPEITNDSATQDIPSDTTEVEKPTVPTFKFSAKGPESDVNLPIAIEVPVPLSRLDSLAFLLEIKQDTLWIPVKREEYRLERADTLSERRFKINFPWQKGQNYRLTVDSLAATDMYGVNSDPLQYEFKTKAPEDLSNLKINLTGLDNNIPAFVQLMASGDKPKYTVPVVNGTAAFEGIEAGKYYARLYEDFNGDGKYTTGSYRLQKVFGEPLVMIDSISVSITDSINTPIDSISIPTNTVSVPDDSIALPGDSIAIESTISISGDSVTLTGDSLTLFGDSIPLSTDSITANLTSKIPSKGFIKPKSDPEIVDSLLRMGYSLVPIETDSVGKDILIALQPDYVYYYPKTINVKKNWDMEQTWDVFETALDLQKPNKIKKNKPKRKNNVRETQEEDEEEEDEFGSNPFDTNRRNNSNNRGNNRNTNGLRQSF